MKENIYTKIMLARKKIQEKNITPTGVNKFQKFKYFELSDIIPVAVTICEELHLFTNTIINEKEGVMIVKDWDTGEQVTFKMALPEFPVEENGNKAMQNAGARLTYTRRYLYLLFLDIVQEDTINKNLGNKATARKRSKAIALKTVISKEQMQELKTDAGLSIALNNIISKNEGSDVTVRDVTSELISLNKEGVLNMKERRSSKKYLDNILTA